LAVEEETYNPGTLNTAVLKYYDAVKKLRDGTWFVDEFEDFLHQRMELSSSHIDELLELVEDCGSADWLPEGTRLIMESTALLEDSIQAMLDKVDEVQVEQIQLEAEYENLLIDAMENEEIDPPEEPLPMDDRIRQVNFDPDLENIEKANSLLLKTLKIIDKFQKTAHEDLEVSM